MQGAQHRSWAAGAAVLGVLVVGAAVAREETEYETAQRTLKAKGQAVTSEAKFNTQAIERKLDHILANQQAILDKLDSMTEELHVIKIRATR